MLSPRALNTLAVSLAVLAVVGWVIFAAGPAASLYGP
jgi:hypothetical protein